MHNILINDATTKRCTHLEHFKTLKIHFQILVCWVKIFVHLKIFFGIKLKKYLG